MQMQRGKEISGNGNNNSNKKRKIGMGSLGALMRSINNTSNDTTERKVKVVEAGAENAKINDKAKAEDLKVVEMNGECCFRYEVDNHDVEYGNFINKVKYNADGKYLYAIDERKIITVFDASNEKNKITIKSTQRESERIYDSCWYRSEDNSKDFILASCMDSPIHLWSIDENDENKKMKIEGSYIFRDDKEVLRAAHSMCFSKQSKNRLLTGCEQRVCIFDINCPGVPVENRPTKETRGSKQGQRGIISTIDSCPDMSGLYAAGSFSGSVCLYGENLPPSVPVCEIYPKSSLKNEKYYSKSGYAFTQVMFSGDNGKYLYTASRRDPFIHCWDIRKLDGTHIFSIPRSPSLSQTNQRIGFDILEMNNGKAWVLATGSGEKEIHLWDVSPRNSAAKGLCTIKNECITDSVSTLSIDPNHESKEGKKRIRVAIGTGQRHFVTNDSDDEKECDIDERKRTREIEKLNNGVFVLEEDIDI